MVYLIIIALVIVLGLVVAQVYLTFSTERLASIVKSLIAQSQPENYIVDAKEQLQTNVGWMRLLRVGLLRAIVVTVVIIVLQIINVHIKKVGEGEIVFGQYTTGGQYYYSTPGIKLVGYTDSTVWPNTISITTSHTLPNTARITIAARLALPRDWLPGVQLTSSVRNIEDLETQVLQPAFRSASLSLLALTEFDLIEMHDMYENQVFRALDSSLDAYNIKVLSVKLVQYDHSVGFEYNYTR